MPLPCTAMCTHVCAYACSYACSNAYAHVFVLPIACRTPHDASRTPQQLNKAVSLVAPVTVTEQRVKKMHHYSIIFCHIPTHTTSQSADFSNPTTLHLNRNLSYQIIDLITPWILDLITPRIIDLITPWTETQQAATPQMAHAPTGCTLTVPDGTTRVLWRYHMAHAPTGGAYPLNPRHRDRHHPEAAFE